MPVHRRGAETAEATQRREERGERMEGKKMWVETLSSSQFSPLFGISLLCVASAKQTSNFLFFWQLLCSQKR
jgi:hypothetical protein